MTRVLGALSQHLGVENNIYSFYFLTREYIDHVVNVLQKSYPFRSETFGFKKMSLLKDFYLFPQPQVLPSRDQKLPITYYCPIDRVFLGMLQHITSQNNSKLLRQFRS